MINNRILVVDDDHNLLTLYKHLLQPSAPKQRSMLEEFVQAPTPTEPQPPVFAVDLIDQGEDAVEQVRRSIIEGRPYALAFVDMRMPPGIDGLETAKKMRALDDRITIVIVTAFSDRSVDEIQQMLQHDVLYVRKPVTHDEILQHARNACIAWDNKDKEREEQHILRQRIDALDLNSAYLLDIISSFNEGVILCRPDHDILFLNHNAVRMTGGRVDELLNTPVDRLFPREDLGPFFEAVIDYNEKQKYLYWVMQGPGGVDKDVLVSGSVLTSAYGTVHSVLLVVNDLDGLRKRLRVIDKDSG
ncbi:MAG: response regulator [Magnetococcales bacterium]|nr:response regulator [Magnetococcales bacterium]